MPGDQHRGVVVGRSVGVAGGKAQRWHSPLSCCDVFYCSVVARISLSLVGVNLIAAREGAVLFVPSLLNVT